MTSPVERIIKPGFENTAPRTSEDFAGVWNKSPERQELRLQIEEYNQRHPLDGDDHHQFAHSRRMEKSKASQESSPFTLSYWGQIRLCMWREFQRLRSDPRYVHESHVIQQRRQN